MEVSFIKNCSYYSKLECCKPLVKEEVPFRPLLEPEKVEYNPCDFDWNEVYLMQYSKNDVKDLSFSEVFEKLLKHVHKKIR